LPRATTKKIQRIRHRTRRAVSAGVIVFGFQKIPPVFQAARQAQTNDAAGEPARSSPAGEPNSPEKSSGDSTVSSAPTEDRNESQSGAQSPPRFPL